VYKYLKGKFQENGVRLFSFVDAEVSAIAQSSRAMANVFAALDSLPALASVAVRTSPMLTSISALLALMAQADVTTLPLKLTEPPLVVAARAEPIGNSAETPNTSMVFLLNLNFI